MSLVKDKQSRWRVTADTSTDYNPSLPLFLKAGGAPPRVVAAARGQVRHAKNPGKPPAGSLKTLRDWCAATNARDAVALKATYTHDSEIQSMTDAQVKTGFFADLLQGNRRNWRIVKMELLGTQIAGVACGWVTYGFMSNDPRDIPGSRGYASFVFLVRQNDGRWLIFAPPE